MQYFMYSIYLWQESIKFNVESLIHRWSFSGITNIIRQWKNNIYTPKLILLTVRGIIRQYQLSLRWIIVLHVVWEIGWLLKTLPVDNSVIFIHVNKHRRNAIKLLFFEKKNAKSFHPDHHGQFSLSLGTYTPLIRTILYPPPPPPLSVRVNGVCLYYLFIYHLLFCSLPSA